MSWLAISAGVLLLVVALVTASRVARAGAGLRRARAELEPRLREAVGSARVAASRATSGAGQVAADVHTAAEAGASLARAARRISVVGQAGVEGTATVRRLRRWANPR